ncbi:MAG: hypothetical protein LBJ00_16730 [Planctomycetaceae bacterium]|nr:hypothetical protein [Planctomycetaceae bacterium]
MANSIFRNSLRLFYTQAVLILKRNSQTQQREMVVQLRNQLSVSAAVCFVPPLPILIKRVTLLLASVVSSTRTYNPGGR